MDFHGLGRPRRLRGIFVGSGFRIQFHGRTSKAHRFAATSAEGPQASWTVSGKIVSEELACGSHNWECGLKPLARSEWIQNVVKRKGKQSWNLGHDCFLGVCLRWC